VSIKRPKKLPFRMEVVYDAESGEVLAARPLDVEPIGDDAPAHVGFEPAANQICQIIEVTAEQLHTGLPEVFATHRLREGRLVPKAGGRTKKAK
jgi:hypothetical protein